MSTVMRWLQGMLLVWILAGCGGGGSDSGQAPAAPLAPAAPAAPSLALDTAASVTKRLGLAGGSLQATGADGTTYTLTVPRRALSSDTAITLTPLRAISNLPSGATLSAGAHLAPEGQKFGAPVSLVVELANPPALPLVPFTYAGELRDRRLYPAAVSNKTITFEIMHFSGYAALNAQTEAMALILGPDGVFAPPSAPGDQALQALVTAALGPPVPAAPRDAAMVGALRGWMDNVIKPRVEAIKTFGSIDLDDESEGSSYTLEGNLFAELRAFDIALKYFILSGGSDSSGAALYDNLKIAVRDTARHVIPLLNDDCGPVLETFFIHTTIIFWWQEFAEHVGAAALDPSLNRASVLADLCVQVAYDPNGGIDFPSGIQPGMVGTPSVRAGYSVNGAPVRFDQPMLMYPDGKLNVTPSGLQVPFSVAAGANQQLQTFLWEPATTEMRIEVDTCMAQGGLEEVCQKAFVVRGVPTNTCPFFSMTVPGTPPATTREFSGVSLGYEYGGGAIGGDNVLSLTSFGGSLTAQSTLYYRVQTGRPPTETVAIVMEWRGDATVEAGGTVSVSMEVDGLGTSTFATATGPLQIQIPVQVRDNDLLKVTFSGTATSTSPDNSKNVNPRGSIPTNAFPAGVRITPVICSE